MARRGKFEDDEYRPQPVAARGRSADRAIHHYGRAEVTYRGFMLAEDLMLLLLDDTTGRPVADGTSVENALAGAVLLDLVASGRVATTPDGKRLHRVDPSPFGNEVLDTALSRVDGQLKPQKAVEKLRKGLRKSVLEHMAAQGVLRPEKSKVLGLFPRTDWHATDPRREEELRRLIEPAMLGAREPDARSGGLISLLFAVKAVHKVFRGDKKELNARAKRISAGNWASDAVRKAVEAVNTAVAAATIAATTAASSGA